MAKHRVRKIIIKIVTEVVLIPLKERKFAGWEGGLAPAQDPHPLNTELTAQAEELFATFRVDFSVEWVGS
jgi:hypothetical protein